MRFFRLSVCVVALLILSGPVSALAAGPERERFRGTEVVDDFCGTGQSVIVSFKGAINWFENAGWGHVTDVWTNPDNGKSVVDSWAGGGKFNLVEHEDGSFTWITQRMGLPVKIRADGGGPLARDAGLVIFYDHFSASGEYLGTDIVIRGGPHPTIEEGLDWCAVMIEALGL